MENSSNLRTPSPGTPKAPGLKIKDVKRRLLFRSTSFSPEGKTMEEILEEMDTDGPLQPTGAVLTGGSFGNISPVRDIVDLVPVLPQKTIGDEELAFVIEEPNNFKTISKVNEYTIEFTSDKIDELNIKIMMLECENGNLQKKLQEEEVSSANKEDAIKSMNDMIAAEREFGNSLRSKSNQQQESIAKLERDLRESESSALFLEAQLEMTREQLASTKIGKEEHRIALQEQINLLNRDVSRLQNVLQNERASTLKFVLDKMGYAAGDILILLTHIRDLNNKVFTLSMNAQFAPDPRIQGQHQ
ncbi:hypothetical protein Fcan01_23280 [Folsomia candida]|uniref:Uncharacterized protein n=1 Tax=Folsomia candida TaxID=158441 RepID=A0A226D9Y2_FOLCA|nr:hypothetical protein Fcan01_23280 [Folsomia candida]